MRRPPPEDRDAPREDFGAILDAFDQQQPSRTEPGRRRMPRPGEKAAGRLTRLGREYGVVELGGKAEGLIPIAELSDPDGQPLYAVGDSLEALVAASNEESGEILLRLRPGQGPPIAAEVAAAYRSGLPIEGVVQEVIKGGVAVNLAGVRAFCPLSQLDLHSVADPATFVGRRLSFRISRYEEGRGRGPNVVVSRRALLEEEARARAEAVRARLAPGVVVRGKVSSLATFGAFLDLGGLEALLPISEIAHRRIEHPKDLLEVGQELEVKVLAIEPGRSSREGERITLSRRALLEDPWLAEAGQLRPGSRHQGKVVRLQPFGAFVELAPGLDGLLHVSELATERNVRHPQDLLKVGQSLEVFIRAVELETRRISLTLANPSPERDEDIPAPPTPAPGQGFGALGDFFRKAGKGR
ncbi:MAG: S1 RNA-binding domain-containing protein [Thermoanaerobaculia bacterium]